MGSANARCEERRRFLPLRPFQSAFLQRLGPMEADAYTALAAGYDFVMRHVDYDEWAAYVHDLLGRHGTDVDRIIELGGGTGALALRLQPLGAYSYLLTDGSAAMLHRARVKIDSAGSPIRCAQADFADVALGDIGASAPADAVVLVFGGLNYLHREARVAALFRTVHRLLQPGGIAVIDHSTPAHMDAHAEDFVDEGATDSFSYVRTSCYDPSTRRQETTVEMNVQGRAVRERHVQRLYSLETVHRLLGVSPLQIVAAYHERTPARADGESRRVHWVLRRRMGSSERAA